MKGIIRYALRGSGGTARGKEAEIRFDMDDARTGSGPAGDTTNGAASEGAALRGREAEIRFDMDDARTGSGPAGSDLSGPAGGMRSGSGGGTFSGEALTALFSLSYADDCRKYRLVLEPRESIELISVELEIETDTDPETRFFANGYQSWTDSREFSPSEGMRGMLPLLSHWSEKYRLALLGDSFFHRYPRRRGVFHSYSCSYFRKKGSDSIRFFGSVDEADGFTLFTWNGGKGVLTVSRDCPNLQVSGTYRALDFVERAGTVDTVFDSYQQDLGIPPRETRILTGWTSWYRHYEKVTEWEVIAAVEGFSAGGYPVDLIQLDDGWQNAVGDWLVVNGKFPGGMKNLAGKISAAGFIPGLWLAPFIAEKRSLLAENHPGWILRDRLGDPVEAGNNPFNWSGLFYALDIENPEVRAYLLEVFRTVIHDWGFRFLKLDFLYAAALGDPAQETRGTRMAQGIELLRKAAGNTPILGCGVPLGPAFGKVEYCRIGSDVALKWEDRRLSLMRYRERVSTINSLTSTIGRYPFSGRMFLNDPDVSILRETEQRLTLEQRKTLFLLNQIFGGLLLVSDNPAEYGPELGALYASQFPVRPKRILGVEGDGRIRLVRFVIDDKTYFCAANLGARRCSITLPEGEWFLDGRVLAGGRNLEISPYAARCLYRLPVNRPCLAGSNHLFPGSDVERFSCSGRDIDVSFHSGKISAPAVFFVTSDGERYTVHGFTAKPVSTAPVSTNPMPLYRIETK